LKKTLIVLLSVLTVVFMATAALAVEVSYEGEVEVKWGNNINNNRLLQLLDENGDPVVDGDGKAVVDLLETDKTTGFAVGSFEASLNVDFLKDFGNGVTAGLKTVTKAHEDDDKFVFDGEGWVQLDRDLFTLKAATEIGGNAAKDLGGEYDLEGAPGLGLDLNLIEGLTINTVINSGPNYGYLAKAEYEQDLFTIGGGYQSECTDNVEAEVPEIDITARLSALSVYGSFNVIEPLTLSAEYATRTGKASGKVAGVDVDESKDITAILASAAYEEEDFIDAKVSFLMQDAGFITLNYADDGDDFLARDFVKGFAGFDHVVIFSDVTFNVTEDFELNGAFDYIVSSKLDDTKYELSDDMSYKIGAAYTIDDLKLEGWYKAFVIDQLGAKATYTLAEDVDTSFEVTYGPEVKDGDGKVSYTAKVTAAL
jgi:hypothetical protein